MSQYALLEEAWDEPVMVQDHAGIFIENTRDKYKSGSYQRYFRENPEFKKYNFEDKPEIVEKTKKRVNNVKPSIIVNEKENYKIENKEEYINDENKNKSDYDELKEYVSNLEKELHHCKTEQLKRSQSLFGDVNGNEMIIFISFGVLMIMILDSFSRLGAKMRNK
jgi:hypothetical protein